MKASLLYLILHLFSASAALFDALIHFIIDHSALSRNMHGMSEVRSIDHGARVHHRSKGVNFLSNMVRSIAADANLHVYVFSLNYHEEAQKETNVICSPFLSDAKLIFLPGDICFDPHGGLRVIHVGSRR